MLHTARTARVFSGAARTAAERLRLLSVLRDGGAGLTALIAGALVVQHLTPAALAVATAALVGEMEGTTTGTPAGGAAAAFAAFGAVLLLRHLCDAAIRPLGFLLKARIDGAHRRRVAALAGASDTVAALEDPHVRDLIRLAAADPTNWTERTPGDGALTQLTLLARYTGMVSGCAVLGAYSLWLVPVLAVPAVVSRAIRRRQWVAATRLWVAGIGEGRRSEYWRGVATGSAEAKEIRVFGFAGWALQRIERHLLAMHAPAWRRQVAILRSEWITFLLAGGSLAAVYAVVLRDVAAGTTSVAVGATVLLAGWSVFLAIGATGDFLDIEGSLPVLRAYRELRTVLEPAATAASTAAGAPRRPPLVEFEQVSFAYPGTDRLVLDRLDLRVQPGELLAIVGLNGAGKSTLTKLLAGLYEPAAGRITVDGAAIREVGPVAWRRRMSVVFQDFVKYHLPIADNVRLGAADRPVDAAALEAAARESGLAEVVQRLPAGWDTPLARTRTGGVDLSGGQWQQVGLARALYAAEVRADLLVLDEPTAHLDVRTEFEIFSRLTRQKGRRTVVLISHRLSTVRQADRIVVLDGGRITESGSHEDLLALGGTYAEMFAIQAQRFAQGDDLRVDDVEKEPV